MPILLKGATRTDGARLEEKDWLEATFHTGTLTASSGLLGGFDMRYEATAVSQAVSRPWKAAAVALRGIKTDGDMAPEISLDRQRPAQYVFSRHVELKLREIRDHQSPARHSEAAE